MNLFRSIERARLARAARREAILGVDSGEDHILADLGPRPVFDPLNSPEHARIAADLNRTAEAEEWRSDLQREEDVQTGHVSTPSAMVSLVFLYFVEALGCTFVLRSLGFESPERILFGLGLAAIIFVLAAGVARRPRWWSVAVFSTLAIAITVIRVNDVTTDDDASAMAWAGALILLAATIGPAILAEKTILRLTPALRSVREMRKYRRRVAAAERTRLRAQAEVEGITRAQAAWDREVERRQHLYRKEHRLAVARHTKHVPQPAGGNLRRNQRSTS